MTGLFFCLQVLLFNDQNYGIHYEYTIPIEPRPGNHSAKTSVPHFMWTHSGWEDCAAMCGGGWEFLFETNICKIILVRD